MHTDPRYAWIATEADPQSPVTMFIPNPWDNLPRVIQRKATDEEMAALRRLAEYDAETDPDPEAWQPWSQSAEEQRGEMGDAA